MSKKLLFATIASILTLNAFADQVVTSRAYVDNADAQKVNIAQGVGTNNANVGKTLVVNSSGNLELGTVSGDNFIEDSITDGVTNKAPSENAVHDALADKQDTIETGLVDFNNGVADLPAIVTYDSTDGVTGNKIGILDFDTIDDDEGTLSAYNGYGSEMDNYVPTVRAVGEELGNIWNFMSSVTPLTWHSTTDTAAVNNYSTTFNGTTNNWPTAQSTQYVRGQAFANALALKQNKIPARQTKIDNSDSTYAPSVVTNGTTDGTVGQMAIITAARMIEDAFVYDDYSNNDNLIPTLGVVGREIEEHVPSFGWNGTTDTAAVNNYSTTFNGTTNNWPTAQSTQYVQGAVLANALALKQNKIPAGTAGNIVTYTGTAGSVGSVATANAPTYNNGTLTNGANIATITAVEAKQNKMTCTRWLNNIETDENCLLWSIE